MRGPGGVYRIAPEFKHAVASDGAGEDFTGIVDDLLARTHKRAYAAVVRNGVLRIVLEQGMQGMPKLPGMDPEIRDNAHALALGKVVLAHSPPEAVDRYIANGLRPFTPNTITSPDELRSELNDIRRTGVADGARGVRRRLLLPRRPDPRPTPPLPRRGGHLDVPPRLQPGARRARGDAPRRHQIPAICGFPHRS